MHPLQNYSEQMGGFNFEFSQRYLFPLTSEINSFNKKMSSNPCHIKRPVPPFVVSSTTEVSFLLLIPEPLVDPSSYKRTAKKFITLHPTFTAVVPVLLPILNLSIFSNHPILNSKDWTVEDKQESAPLSYRLPKCFTSIKDNWELISSSVDTMFWVPICAWSVLRESTISI